jgi:hypothetical protein
MGDLCTRCHSYHECSAMSQHNTRYDTTTKKCAAAIGGKENPGLSCKDILDKKGPRNSANLYWINPGSGTIQVLCDMETDGGGWTMVASNSHKDRRFPIGTSRCGWYLHKSGYNQNPSMDKDYLIGPCGARFVFG